MGNTVTEKESIEHRRYTVMFPILSGFMRIGSRFEEYTCLPTQLAQT
jgi:hypothetical protein